MGKTAHEDFWPYSPMDNWDCIKEVTGESETVYHIPQGQILSFIRGGVTYSVSTDALGSVRMITDDVGEVVARFEYGAFGEAISVTEDPALADFPYRFVGALGVRHEPDTNLLYMRQRWFDVQLGRFISRDPLGIKAGENLYVYAANNPVTLSDPDGLNPYSGKSRHELAEPARTWTLAYHQKMIYEASKKTGVPCYVIAALLAMERINDMQIYGSVDRYATHWSWGGISDAKGPANVNKVVVLDKLEKENLLDKGVTAASAYQSLNDQTSITYGATYLKYIADNIVPKGNSPVPYGTPEEKKWTQAISLYNKMTDNYSFGDYSLTILENLQNLKDRPCCHQ